MELTSTTTVNKPPQEVYGFWHRLENLVTSWRTWTTCG
jgi:uncharacterized membrane protein